MLNTIKKKIKKIEKKINKIKKIKKKKKLNIIYRKYLGKNGYLKNIIKIFNKIPKKNKPYFGKKINNIKNKIIKKINKKYKKKKKNKNNKFIDISLPCKKFIYGNIHPITITINNIEEIFNELGFLSINGNEIENKYYNFNSLNIKKNHPSRSSKDTFWINNKYLLRTQTSCIQTKYMKNKKPPIKVIYTGCVFRKDFDKNHTPMFHQTEIFIIDKKINFSNLIYIIKKFLNIFFNKKIKIKIIPSYFPFTEPSYEIYIKNNKNKWIEIIGCGLIHPNILKFSNISSNKYSGLALGIGIERLTMIKYNINNIKILYKNNINFLNKF